MGGGDHEGDAASTRLHVRVGHSPGGVFKLRHVGDLVDRVRVGDDVVEGFVEGWARVAVLAGQRSDARFYELAPDPGARAELLGEGGFFVRGGFRIVEAIRTAKRSRAMWKGFVALSRPVADPRP
jgi:hypothetical protein